MQNSAFGEDSINESNSEALLMEKGTHEEITVGKMMQNSALGEDSINESNLEGPVDGKGYVKPVFGEPEIVEISARAPQFKKSIVH
ncbi:hypothetical protein HHI36_016643 [Cryptolaemus montrouzieri]